MTFTRICDASALPPGEALRIDSSPIPVALFNVGGIFFATQDRCPHGDWSLAEGFLEGDVVECPLHAAKFCVRDGAVLAPPATTPLLVFAVKQDADAVYVDLEPPLDSA